MPHLPFEASNGSQVFVPKKGSCGYYFISPGQKPHVEYGVQTEDDLLQEAKKYLNR